MEFGCCSYPYPRNNNGYFNGPNDLIYFESSFFGSLPSTNEYRRFVLFEAISTITKGNQQGKKFPNCDSEDSIFVLRKDYHLATHPIVNQSLLLGEGTFGGTGFSAQECQNI